MLELLSQLRWEEHSSPLSLCTSAAGTVTGGRLGGLGEDRVPKTEPVERGMWGGRGGRTAAHILQVIAATSPKSLVKERADSRKQLTALN